MHPPPDSCRPTHTHTRTRTHTNRVHLPNSFAPTRLWEHLQPTNHNGHQSLMHKHFCFFFYRIQIIITVVIVCASQLTVCVTVFEEMLPQICDFFFFLPVDHFHILCYHNGGVYKPSSTEAIKTLHWIGGRRQEFLHKHQCHPQSSGASAGTLPNNWERKHTC